MASSTQSRTSFKMASLVVRLASNFFEKIMLRAKLKASPLISVDVLGIDSGVRVASVEGVSGVCDAFRAWLSPPSPNWFVAVSLMGRICSKFSLDVLTLLEEFEEFVFALLLSTA